METTSCSFGGVLQCLYTTVLISPVHSSPVHSQAHSAVQSPESRVQSPESSSYRDPIVLLYAKCKPANVIINACDNYCKIAESGGV